MKRIMAYTTSAAFLFTFNSVHADSVYTPSNTQTGSYAGTVHNEPNSNDRIILKEVHDKIKTTKSVADLSVDITISNGVIYLNGTVDTDSEASALIETVQSVPQVKDVDTSNLKVTKSSHPLSDTYITAKVKGLFIREKLFGDKDISVWEIKVETKNGTVYLLGNADNNQQIVNARNLSRQVVGVKNVKSKVTIKK